MFKKEIRGPILGLFVMSLGGLLLHLRIHPVSKTPFNWIAVVFGLMNVCVLPFLFNYKKTMPWGYMINFITVIVGTVTMAYFSITHWDGALTIKALILKSTLADILILWAKVPLANVILRHFRPKEY